MIGEPVAAGSRSGATTQRNDQRFASFAQRDEVFEPQIVEQLHAHRVDGEDVYRKRHTFRRAGRRVAVAVTPEEGDLPVGDELHGGGMQPGPSGCGIPRPDFGPAPAVAHAHEQKIAPPDAETLIALGSHEVVDGDVIAGLQP